MLKRILIVAASLALFAGTIWTIAQEPNPPEAASSKTVQHHFVRRWTLSSPEHLRIDLRLPSGWCIAEGASFHSADFYRPSEEFPTFLAVNYARLPMPFQTLCQKDIERLSQPEEGKAIAVQELPSLLDGRMTVFRFDAGGKGTHLLVGYLDVQGEYVVKVTLSNAEAISSRLERDFEKVVSKMKITANHPPMSQEDALAEAGRRVRAAGAEGMRGVSYGGGDGTSYESAVTISKVRNLMGCVSAQYAWLDAHYPGYEVQMHFNEDKDGRNYSVLRFSFEGQQKEIYFDISECPER